MLWIIATVLAPQASGNQALDAWSGCVQVKAIEWASTKEPAGDVANAAVAACQAEETYFAIQAGLKFARIYTEEGARLPANFDAQTKAHVEDIRRTLRNGALTWVMRIRAKSK